jgi:hypothetical protein
MVNAIDAAIQSTKANASGIASSAASSAAAAASAAAADAIASKLPSGAADKLKKLPLTKDPELLKHQLKAEGQKVVGEAQEMLQQEVDRKTEGLKDKVALLASLSLGAVSLYVKLDIIDPKVIATKAFLKAQQEFREIKQKASRQNLKKAKESFTFPMKPPTSLSGIPKIPEVPKLPTLPKLPSIPNISNLPSAPNISDIINRNNP